MRQEFNDYKEFKDEEFAHFESRYSKFMEETSSKVSKFQETITVNVGGFL